MPSLIFVGIIKHSDEERSNVVMGIDREKVVAELWNDYLSFGENHTYDNMDEFACDAYGGTARLQCSDYSVSYELHELAQQ